MTAGTGARAVAATLLCALAVLACAPARARAVASVGPAARALASNRLYVDPAVANTIDTQTRTRIAFRLQRRAQPVYVALVPFAQGDAFDGDGPRFLNALAGRAQRPGVYVTYDARGILWTSGYRVSRDIAGRADQASRVVDEEARFEGPPGPRIESFLAALDDPDLDARERAASGGGVPAGGDGQPAGAGGGGGGLLALVVAIAVVLAAGAALLVVGRRRRARPADDRPLLPARVFALARAASREDLADRADEMLIALSARIDQAPASAGTQRALDAYEAAERVLRAAKPDLPDLVGALVCIDLGRAALDGEAQPPPPCTYDPRHGPATGRPVRVQETELRLCRACRADVRAGRPANVLRDGTGNPYLDDDGPWAASGYGAWGDPIRAVLAGR